MPTSTLTEAPPTGLRPSVLLAQHRDQVLAILDAAGLRNVRVFGSVARGEDTATSDIDLLYERQAGVNALDVAEAWADVVNVLGCQVDLVSIRGLKAKHAQIRKEAIPL